MKNKGDRYNAGKPKWTLMHFPSFEPMIRVLEFGCKKYSRDNWKKYLDPNETLDSLQRHIIELMEGKVFDKESGLPIIGHVMCNAMFYAFHTRKKYEKNNIHRH
jgi:hypothetical protein